MRTVICLLPFLFVLAACGGDGGPTVVHGYVEGEFLRVGAEDAGRIMAVAVARGAAVAPGDVLFTLDDSVERAARDEAAARLAQAEAELADLGLGQRAEEIAVIDAQLAQARATRDRAEKDYARQAELVRQQAASVAVLDAARAERDRAAARVAELAAARKVATLPARPDEIRAARQALERARAALDQAQRRLARRTVRAPQGGIVDDVLRWPGEIVPTGGAVINLLPPENRYVRFFVPLKLAPGLSVGDEVAVACDGCPGLIGARIRMIADDVEFTPPVVFTVKNRQKMVIMMEAMPLSNAEALKPGLPVDVHLPQPKAPA
ncbi:MAG: HlyD family efflux transporter periplasmic adaptor subunit [Alphaproteobacteria bacterium]|nr:MAG: HlyD family efflux transporter periplasmic adaptor subunit [Alphaproteobacteria bacterium]